MARVVALYAFWQQPLAAALAPTRECGATSFGAHPRAEAVLALSRSL
jgi:hypothetical protein